MVSFQSLYQCVRGYFYFDERSYYIAKSLAAKYGEEQARGLIRTYAERAEEVKAVEWQNVEKALRDLTRPQMPYHL